jgi:signal transduction histidine kinase
MAMQIDRLERTTWLIRLRWLACAGLFLAPFFVLHVFKIRLNWAPIAITALFIAAYNTLLSLAVMKTRDSSDIRFAKNVFYIDNAQIALDLICLTVVIHFSGGVENPLIFYFIFHIIISSILLSRLNALWQTNLAAVLFIGMTALEYTGALKHEPVEGFLPTPLYNSLLYVSGIAFVFLSTLYISLYLASSISKRLRDREKNLEDANKLLEEKDRIKSEYVLRVSHDIKGHIAAIQSTIDPVRTGITGPLTPGQLDMLNRADERSSKLLAFVKSLLNLTIMRLKDSEDIMVFDLASAVMDAVNFVRPGAKEKNITLDAQIPAQGFNLRASKSEINATLIEMLSNAIRYTPAGGKVTLLCDKKDKGYVIEIRDTGIGIPKSEISKIFTEFHRAPNARALDSSSSGLGLAMAKHVVEKAGGRITVESEENKGSVFKIEFGG